MEILSLTRSSRLAHKASWSVVGNRCPQQAETEAQLVASTIVASAASSLTGEYILPFGGLILLTKIS
jgi:hypothetical protein